MNTEALKSLLYPHLDSPDVLLMAYKMGCEHEREAAKTRKEGRSVYRPHTSYTIMTNRYNEEVKIGCACCGNKLTHAYYIESSNGKFCLHCTMMDEHTITAYFEGMAFPNTEGWISVKSYLPPVMFDSAQPKTYSEYVLITDGNTVNVGSYQFWLHGGSWHKNDTDESNIWGATHWQPLPTVPAALGGNNG